MSTGLIFADWSRSTLPGQGPFCLTRLGPLCLVDYALATIRTLEISKVLVLVQDKTHVKAVEDHVNIQKRMRYGNFETQVLAYDSVDSAYDVLRDRHLVDSLCFPLLTMDLTKFYPSLKLEAKDLVLSNNVILRGFYGKANHRSFNRDLSVLCLNDQQIQVGFVPPSVPAEVLASTFAKKTQNSRLTMTHGVQDAGVYLISAEAVGLLRDTMGQSDIAEDLNNLISDQFFTDKISSNLQNFQWFEGEIFEVSHPRGLYLATQSLNKVGHLAATFYPEELVKSKTPFYGQTCEIDGTACITACLLGDNVIIEANADLENCVIGAGAVIKTNVSCLNVVVPPGQVVEIDLIEDASSTTIGDDAHCARMKAEFAQPPDESEAASSNESSDEECDTPEAEVGLIFRKAWGNRKDELIIKSLDLEIRAVRFDNRLSLEETLKPIARIFVELFLVESQGVTQISQSPNIIQFLEDFLEVLTACDLDDALLFLRQVYSFFQEREGGSLGLANLFSFVFQFFYAKADIDDDECREFVYQLKQPLRRQETYIHALSKFITSLEGSDSEETD